MGAQLERLVARGRHERVPRHVPRAPRRSARPPRAMVAGRAGGRAGVRRAARGRLGRRVRLRNARSDPSSPRRSRWFGRRAHPGRRVGHEPGWGVVAAAPRPRRCRRCDAPDHALACDERLAGAATFTSPSGGDRGRRRRRRPRRGIHCAHRARGDRGCVWNAEAAGDGVARAQSGLSRPRRLGCGECERVRGCAPVARAGRTVRGGDRSGALRPRLPGTRRPRRLDDVARTCRRRLAFARRRGRPG